MKDSVNQVISHKWVVFAAVGIMIMMINLDATIIYLALAPIAKAFHSSITAMQWVVNIYLLVTASLFIFAGRIADIFGRKNVFLFGVLMFTCASLLAGLATSQTMLIVARALQGVGFACTFTLAILIVTSYFPVAKRGFAIGSIICVTGFSQAIGPTLGGVILNYFSWRWIFLMNLPLGLVSILLMVRFCKRDTPQHAHQQLDVVGAVVLLCALSSLIFSLNMLGSWGLFSGKFLLLLLAAILLLTLFFFLERKTKNPLINFSVLSDTSFIAVNILRFIYMYCWLIILFLLPLYLQNIEGLSPLKAGAYLLFMTALFGVLSPFMGKLLDRYGSKVPTIIALLFAMAGLICFMLLKYFAMFTPLVAGLLFFGISAGIILSSSAKAALATLKNRDAAVGLGVFYALAFLGGGAGIALAGSQLKTQGFYYFRELMHKTHIILSPQQFSVMRDFVSGSSSLQRLHKLMPVIDADRLIDISRHAFLDAFSNIMTVCVILMIIAILAGFKLYSKDRELGCKNCEQKGSKP